MTLPFRIINRNLCFFNKIRLLINYDNYVCHEIEISTHYLRIHLGPKEWGWMVNLPAPAKGRPKAPHKVTIIIYSSNNYMLCKHCKGSNTFFENLLSTYGL